MAMSNLSFVERDEKLFYGNWKVRRYNLISEEESKIHESEIVGTEMTLEEGYEVRWKIPNNIDAIPLFSCESYEVILTDPIQLTFISSVFGRIGPFSAHFDDLTKLQLTFDTAFVLYCEKIARSEAMREYPFSFLSALENGYFTDYVITSATEKNYGVHRIILSLGFPEIVLNCQSSSSKKLSSKSSQLHGLPDTVLKTILHYLYSCSLPPSITETEAKECMKAISKLPGLDKLSKICGKFVENYAVRTQIENLCNDIEECFQNITNHITVRHDTSAFTSEQSYLWQGIKYAARESAVGCVKIAQICKLFSDRRNELSREERHRIMKRCWNRLPNLLLLSAKFLETLAPQLTKLSSEGRNELASYFLTEVEPLFDQVTKIVSEVRKTLETIMDSDVVSSQKKESFLSKTLKSAIHIRELAKLRFLHGEFVRWINYWVTRKEQLSQLSDHEKVETVSHKIEMIAEDIPLLVERILNFHDNLEARFSWPQWKYYFKLGSAKVAWMIEKSKYSKTSLSETIEALRRLVKRDEFDDALNTLNLIDSEQSEEELSDSRKQPEDIESLCVPPLSRDSILSSRAEEILTNADHTFTDMKFVLHCADSQNESSTVTVMAHRVIVACHCDWFRRALLSGMKEDIERQINIYDCSPDLFHHVLRYIYTGRLDCSALPVETLTDLILLSDQYEMDSLKSLCEDAIKPDVSNDNVLELLTIGDRLNASVLRKFCMDHIIHHPAILESDVFNQLPPKLQADVRELTQWSQRESTEGVDTISLQSVGQNIAARRMSENLLEVDSEMEPIINSTTSLARRAALDDEGVVQICKEVEDLELLESCCEQLRNILGEDIPLNDLEQLSLVANFDVNRAVNHYFSSKE